MLPKKLSAGQKIHIEVFHPLNQLNREVGVITGTPVPVVVPKTPYVLLDLLLGVRMPQLEFGLAFAHIVALASVACGQINKPITIAGEFFFNSVLFTSICTFEFLSFF